MDGSFPSEPLKTPCISDTVTAEDFTSQIQTSASSSAEYHLQVFSPSFDAAGGSFGHTTATLKAGASTAGQNETKEFLVDDNIMDLQLYDSLQNHHNYSLKPAEPAATSGHKQGNNSVGNFGMVSSMTGHLAEGHNDLDNARDSDDQSMDISDPLKEICRSSSPLFVPSQSKDQIHSINLFVPSQSKQNQVHSSPLFVPSQAKESQVHHTDTVFHHTTVAEKRIENVSEQKQGLFEGEQELPTDLASSIKELNNLTKVPDKQATSSREITDISGDVNKVGSEVNEVESRTHSLEALEAIGDKTMFSENLGLIPTDTDMKTLAGKKRPIRKGVRTRKSFDWSPHGDLSEVTERGPIKSSNNNRIKSETVKGNKNDFTEVLEREPVKGHKHIPGPYRCGSCKKSFVTICKLHQHLFDHSIGGSYHYNHALKTAFPKFDTVCAFSQTNEAEIKLASKIKASGKSVKFKSKPVDESPATDGTKRKRRRSKKLAEAEERSAAESEEKHKLVCKLKVKSEDGGNTWTGVKTEQKEVKRLKTKQQSMPEIDDMQDFRNELDENEATENENEDKFMIEIVNDSALSEKECDKDTATETNSSTKKRGKRKMSIPRKISHPTGSETIKIINSRSKPKFKIKCDFCSSQFQYTRGLIRHEQEKHGDEMKFKCDICDQKYMRAYNLERHKLCSHTTGKSRLLRQRKGLAVWRERKKRGRKPVQKQDEDLVTCEICGQGVPESKTELHIRLHTGERPFICHVCGKGLISDKKLKRHLLIHSDVRRHTCDVCGEGFAMKNKLRTHMFLHTGHKPYLCSVCGAEFNNSTSLLHHHRTVHLGDKRFECTVCGGRYGKKSQLEEHMFSHSTDRMHTCRFCGKTFKHGKSLRRHENTHVSDTKFSCDQCDSKFSRKDNLERHKMSHVETSLQCRFCKKKFRDRAPLYDHEEYHVKQRKYQCLVCKEKFQDETYFYNHMEKSHELSRKTVDAMAMAQEDAAAAIHDDNEEVAKKTPKKQQSAKDLPFHTVYVDGQVDQLDEPGTITIVQDTLNLSMNLAGIIPSSGQDMAVAASSGLLQVPSSLNNVLSSNLDPSHNIIIANGSHQILNQPGNPNFPVATSRIIPGVHNAAQIAAFETISTTEQGGLRLPVNPQSATIALTTDNIIVQEHQQRLMQEALGNSLNIQASAGLRMQNMF